MLSPIIEKRIEKFEALLDELEVVCENDDRVDSAVGIIEKLRIIASVLGDDHEDAEDVLGEYIVRLKNQRRDGMEDAFRAALEKGKWVTTENNHKIHIAENGKADIGNPHVLSAINDAINQKESDEKSGKGKDKKVGKNVPSDYGSPYPIDEISADGENKPCKGFSQGGLRRHKDGRHKAQYANMTDEQYESHAINLLKKKCGADIFGYRCSDGCVCRFNNLTGEFAKGYPGGIIKTCFYPTLLGTDPAKIDVEYARRYFRAMKREESLD